jgi:hypothetical protein
MQERGLGVGGFGTTTHLITGSTLQRMIAYLTEGVYFHPPDRRSTSGLQNSSPASQPSALNAQRVARILERGGQGRTPSPEKVEGRGRGKGSPPSPSQKQPGSTPGLGTSAHSTTEDSYEEEI